MRAIGLSPRVRGSPNTKPFRICPADDAIPACAGEPLKYDNLSYLAKVYPRVCGEAFEIRQLRSYFTERVYPRVCGGAVEIRQFSYLAKVYPRVCGEAVVRQFVVFGKGLSPRVRGSLFVPRIPFRQGGSIGHGKGSYPVG